MAPTAVHNGSARPGTYQPSPRRKTQVSPSRRPARPQNPPDAVRRKNLSKSLTEFFSKLRPSNRPERGGTIRPRGEDDGERQPAAPTPPRPSPGCRKMRSRSFGGHGPDTIPANLWNTAITPPRRAHSVGSARRKPVGSGLSPNRRRPGAINSPLNVELKPGSNPNSIPRRPVTRPYPQPHPGPNVPLPRTHLPLNQTYPSPSSLQQPTPLPVTATCPHSTSHHHNHPHPPSRPHNHPQNHLQSRPHPNHPDNLNPNHDPNYNPTPSLEHAALRRRHRRTLISSGDFLGVTGANPYTGELDVVTPPTSSEDAVVTTSSSSVVGAVGAAAASVSARAAVGVMGMNAGTGMGRGIAAGMDMGIGTGVAGGDGRGAGMRTGTDARAGVPNGEVQGHAQGQQLPAETRTGNVAVKSEEWDQARREAYNLEARRREKDMRRMLREEERLCRAEQRKDQLREVLVHHRVKWRKEEGGWSSVAEPKLSPIMQSPQGSGKSSLQSDGLGGVQRSLGVVMPEGKHPFLGMAAAARVNSCRRQMGGGMGVLLVARPRPGRVRLGTVVEGKGSCLLRKAVARFCLQPPVPRREGSLLDARPLPLLHQPPEWELGNLIAIPVDLRRLSQDCMAQQIPTSRVLELEQLDSAEPWAGKLLHGLDKQHNQHDIVLQTSSAERGHGLAQVPLFACTRTTTTTGSGHSQLRSRLAIPPFDGMLDGSWDAPPTGRVWTHPALSRSTSRLSSAMTHNSAYSERPGSPTHAPLSAWRNISSPGPQRSTSSTVQKTVGIGPQGASPIPHQHRGAEPGVDNVTTSSTDRGRTVPVQQKDVVKPFQPTVRTENLPPQQADWAMRKTMRQPSSPTHHPHDDSETDARSRSSPTCTRTSTYLPMTQPQPLSPRSPASTPQVRPGQQQAEHQAQTIARAARIAFVHHELGPGNTSWMLPRRPISGSGSAPDPGSHPHGARAAGRAAKTAAKPVAVTGARQGQGQGKGKGEGQARGQDQMKGKSQGKEGGKKEKDGEKEEGGQQKGQANGEGKEAKVNKGEMGNLEYRRWMRNAVLMLARMVGAYWQVVSPVFDGDSGLRRRVDKAQATRGDVLVCLLAVVFLFLVVCVSIRGVRGIVWAVRLLSELGELLRYVAGL